MNTAMKPVLRIEWGNSECKSQWDLKFDLPDKNLIGVSTLSLIIS